MNERSDEEKSHSASETLAQLRERVEELERLISSIPVLRDYDMQRALVGCWETELRLTRVAITAIEGLEIVQRQILDTHERAAEQMAIDAEFGVSEWESFMPSQYHAVTKTLATMCEQLSKV